MPSPRRKPKNAPARASSPAEQEREYRMLGLALTETEGFSLILATYDDPRRRDELIDRLAAEGQAQHLLVTRLDLAALGRGTVLLRALREHVAATPVPPGWRRAVMVVGLEELLDYHRMGARPDALAVLHDANLHRDAFPAACPAPVVIWLSPLATTAFAQAAPDLWHWRTATFDFTSGARGRLEFLDATLAGRDFEQDERSRRALEERVALLQELLLELERTPAETIGQRARRMHLLGQLAWAQLRLGRAREALTAATEQLTIAREIGDRRGEASALGNLGSAYTDLGELRRAIELYEQQLAITREIGDRRGEASALDGLGNACTDLGELRPAIELYEQALVIAREIGDRWGSASALGSLGNAYYALGELRPAIELYEQQLAIAREIGDRRGEAGALGNLGNAYYALGEPRRAIELYEQALVIAREIGDRRGEGNALFNIGLTLDTLGDGDEAVERVRAALGIFEEIEDPNAAKVRALLAEWGAEGSR